MPTKVLICDDSGFARRQMARAMPDAWNVEICFAENGEQAIELIKKGKADVMFLDLNMPVMDGYQTMDIIKQQDLPTLVIVVSGDVQPEARARMIKMGALDFIRKPIDNDKLTTILAQYGIYSGDKKATKKAEEPASKSNSLTDKLDAYREMSNIAMGQAGEKLAKLLGEFVDLPIPNVNIIETTELHMAISEIRHNDQVSAISQGFISAGITGEALLICNDLNFNNMVKLLNYSKAIDSEELELEALMDVTNIIVSACLNALSDQLNVNFTHNHPIILGRHCGLDELLNNNVSRWNRVLAIEIGYAIKSRDIHFDLLLMFPDKSIDFMFDKLIKMAG